MSLKMILFWNVLQSWRHFKTAFSVNVFWKRLGVNLCVSCCVMFSVLWLDKDSVSRGCWSGYSGVFDLTTMMTSLKFWFHFALFLVSWIRRFGATVHTERERTQTLDPTRENSLNSSGMLSSSSTSSSHRWIFIWLMWTPTHRRGVFQYFFLSLTRHTALDIIPEEFGVMVDDITMLVWSCDVFMQIEKLQKILSVWTGIFFFYGKNYFFRNIRIHLDKNTIEKPLW